MATSRDVGVLFLVIMHECSGGFRGGKGVHMNPPLWLDLVLRTTDGTLS